MYSFLIPKTKNPIFERVFPLIADFENGWSYFSILSYVFIVWCLIRYIWSTTFIVTFIFAQGYGRKGVFFKNKSQKIIGLITVVEKEKDGEMQKKKFTRNKCTLKIIFIGNSYFRETNNHPGSKEILLILGSLKVHYFFHNIASLVPMLDELNPICILNRNTVKPFHALAITYMHSNVYSVINLR
jgi:hypothetical protein